MIKAIIFDCFGVLVGAGFKETYRQAGGHPLHDKEFIDDLLHNANLGQMTLQEMNQKVANQIGITLEEWRKAVDSTEQPNQDVLNYVQQLKDKYKVAILSNANIGTLPRKLSPEQLAIFDEVVVSAEVGAIKPEPAIYKLTAERLGVKPEECIFIDDIKLYCEGAETVGMKTIYYENFHQLQEDLEVILTVT